MPRLALVRPAVLVFLLAAGLGGIAPALAATVTLAWNPASSAAVRGYRVYVAPVGTGALTQPPKAPATSVDVGGSTSATLTGLVDGTAYQFAVTSYDAAGSESSFSNVVQATPGSVPVAGFTASTTRGTAPLALNFSNASTGAIEQYAWTFGDGTTSTSANPAKVYASPGTYTVSLKVTGPAGSDTLTRSGYIVVSAPSTTGALLSASFDGGSLAGWSVHDDGTLQGPSAWSIVSGELAQRSNVYGGSVARSDPAKPGTYLLYDGGLAWTDYRVKFRMRGTDDDAMGLMFRYGDANNYYRFSWDRERGYRRLVKKVNGTFTQLAGDATAYAKGRNYEVEVVAAGTLLEVWIDGTRVFRVNDAARPKGSIAFYTWGQKDAYFDNLTVR